MEQYFGEKTLKLGFGLMHLPKQQFYTSLERHRRRVF